MAYSELSMGPFCVTQPNPTQPNPWTTLGPLAPVGNSAGVRNVPRPRHNCQATDWQFLCGPRIHGDEYFSGFAAEGHSEETTGVLDGSAMTCDDETAVCM